MNVDLVTNVVDIICTVWEGILGAYLIKIYTLKSNSQKKDVLWVCFFAVFVSAMTFLSFSSTIKIIVELFICAFIICWLYRIRILNGFLAMLLFIFSSVLTEMILTTGLGFWFADLTNSDVFKQTEYYLIYHILMTMIVVIMRKTLKNIGENFTKREEILLSIILAALNFVFISVVNTSLFGGDLFTQTTMAIGIIILFAALFLLIYFVNDSVRIRLLQQKEEQQLQRLEAQYRYYEERLKDEERVRRVYHDMKNHLLVLQAQMKTLSDKEDKDKKSETEEMIESLRREISDYEDYVQTGNGFLDIILKDKIKAAKEKHIDFHTEVDFPKGDFMEPLDISTIFGNALDNAIEACKNIPEEERFITLKVGVKRNFLVISVENSAKQETEEKGTTKADTFLHGFGLKNIQRAAEKYGGQCKRNYQCGVYMLSILIPTA